MKYAVLTHTFQSELNVGLSYNHYTFGSKNVNKLILQNYKSLVGYLLKNQVYCNGILVMTFCAWYIALKARMVGYQLNLATNSKIIHESKGSILLICNL